MITRVKNRPHYFLPEWIQQSDRVVDTDVCIYGGTAAGVTAAMAVTRAGKHATIIHPGNTLGGMTTGGLGETDFGNKDVVGGYARQFYRDLGAHNGRDEEWKFEPHVAQLVIDDYIRRHRIEVIQCGFLRDIQKTAGRIAELRCLGGLRLRASMFIDATYEGDLMAQVGVSFAVGRESNTTYGETVNGVQIREHHQFNGHVDPYIREGDPSSGTLPFVNARAPVPIGSGDGRVQAYNFRVCMTDDPSLKIALQRPDAFEPLQYELARRWFSGEKDDYNEQLGMDPPHRPRKFDPLTQRTANGFLKTDTNNHGAVSSDFIGANYAWPEADYAQREMLFQQHVDYQMGLYWFLANDAGVPQRYRDAYSRWGLAGDEFTATGGWPHQLYVREARRMVTDHVLTEADTQHFRRTEQPVAIGSYNMDSHNCQRFVHVDEAGNACVRNEGDVQLPPAGPYGVDFRSIVPRADECQNLLVPVCLAASHIAYGSVRMEPVFMSIAESAGIAAALAIDARSAIQAVDYRKLTAELTQANLRM